MNKPDRLDIIIADILGMGVEDLGEYDVAQAKAAIQEYIDQQVGERIGKMLFALPADSRKHLKPLFDAALGKLEQSDITDDTIKTADDWLIKGKYTEQGGGDNE